MHPAPPRCVVFALADLPEGDRRHILEVAHRLRLPVDPGLLRAPLVLSSEPPPLAAELSLRGDDELAERGPALLLLAVRLLLADAYHWPEQRFLRGGAPPEVEAGYTIYAADPQLWTSDTLATALDERAHLTVRRGLSADRRRPPVSPGDAVPVLGWQVPVLGRKDPADVRDLRPAELREQSFAGETLPLGMVPLGGGGRYRHFLRVTAARREAGALLATVELAQGDDVSGVLRRSEAALRLLNAGAADAGDGDIGDDAREGDLDLLRDLLPGLVLSTPAGGTLLLDLYRLGIAAHGPQAPRVVAGPPRVDEEWAPLVERGDLSAAQLELSDLSSLLVPEEARLSPGGGFACLRFSGRRDGLPVDAALVLDVRGTTARVLAWPLDLDGPAPALAFSEDDRVLAVAPAAGRPAVSPSCLGETDEVEDTDQGGLWLIALPEPRPGGRLHSEPGLASSSITGGASPSAVTITVQPALRLIDKLVLPVALRGPGLSVQAIPGRDALVCHRLGQACAVDLTPGEMPHVRALTEDDRLALLTGEGGGPLRRFLRALCGVEDALDEVPQLAFLGIVAGQPARLREAAPALLREPVAAAAAAVLRLLG